jgi:two-component SAPR family response regulator
MIDKNWCEEAVNALAAHEHLDGLLRKGRYQEAVMRMECGILEGCPPNPIHLKGLPKRHLSASPLLLLFQGESYGKQGQLSEAAEALELAVKGFAAQGLTTRLVESMAILSELRMRMGNISEAVTLLTFVHDEYRNSPTKGCIPHVVRALAVGGPLIGLFGEEIKLYLEAVLLFEAEGRIPEACRTVIDVLLNCGSEIDEHEWKKLDWALRRNSGLYAPARIYSELLQALWDMRCRRWNAAAIRLRGIHYTGELPYDLSARIELAHLSASAHEGDPQGKSLLDSPLLLREKYADDLLLQYDVLRTLADASQRLRLNIQTEDWEKESAAIGKLLGKSVIRLEPEQVRSSEQNNGDKWRVSLFGGLCFRRRDQEIRGVRWKRRKAQELLLHLLLQHHYTSTKEQIAELLGLGDDPEKSAKSLYVIVHQLKQTLHSELAVRDGVTTKEGLVSLREDAFDYVDVEQYLALVRVADQLWSEDRELSREMYQQAYAVYDELLPELPYVSWLEAMREYITTKQAAVIRRCCILAEDREDWLLAEAYLLEWIKLKPHHEEAYRQLIGLLLRNARRQEAEIYYAQWTYICRDDLGAEPSFSLDEAQEGRV